MKPPICKKIDNIISQHEHIRNDEYSWLRDDNWKDILSGNLNFANPEILEYIKSENEYKDFIMKDSKDCINIIYEEILMRIKEDNETVPYKKGEYYYYNKEKKGFDYPLLCRKKVLTNNTISDIEEVYFDINNVAKDKQLYSFRKSQINKSNSFFAYTFSLSGSMESILKVRNLENGEDYDWQIDNTTGAFIWVNEFELYFIERNENSMGQKLYKIDIRENTGNKVLIFDKPEEYKDMFMNLTTSTDKEYIILTIGTNATDNIFISKTGSDKFDMFITGENGVKYIIDHHKQQFYILTNKGSNDFQIFKTNVDYENWDFSNWITFITEEKNKCLINLHIYNDYLVIERKNNILGLPEIITCNTLTKEINVLNMPDQAYDIEFIGAWDHNDTKLRVIYETPVSPQQTMELDVTDLTLKTIHTKVVPNYIQDNYVLKRHYVKARDEESIPLTIVYKKGLKLNSDNPVFMIGYGSYGYGYSAYFDLSIFSLVDRGFVYCTPHIRGGNEKGEMWHNKGKMRNKMNTFNDFIACCEYLIEQKYTAPNKISIQGGSAGGLLMGAVANMRPDLFNAVIAGCPFVDILNTISDESLPMSVADWEEFGDPVHNKKDFEYILSYSPYDNIKKQDYPMMLYYSAISDENVTYWEATKMVAKLREKKTDNKILILKMNMYSGHSGVSKKQEWIEDLAFNYCFILKAFGISDK